MRVTKPNWVEHAAGEKKTKSPIYSLSVHPDNTRLATGGQDNKVKIWSTLPILDKEAQDNDANHKLLCTMSAHTGPVLTVRWAHHGRYLASGSDDSVLMVWDIDPAGGGRVFGSEEVNVENWKALRRLVGHVADVVDCAWSRDDSMLASVGLDSKIFIWDGFSFDRLRTIDAHQGFVKGVCWDPVGNYLATQSDDKTVRIWNTEDWSAVQTVSRPFEMSPQSTFFRRLSWSPDGAFIAASNAMNGPVFVAAVIEREGWTSDISFVGHENTIQVAAFNPRLFFRDGDKPGRVSASCMVALGADDFNISIWRNTLHKPLAIIRDIFARQLLDLCWSNDGLVLYGCSADGTICAIAFEPHEFPELAQAEDTLTVLDEYGFKPSRQRPAQAQRALAASSSFLSPTAFPSTSVSEQVNVIIPRKGKPKDRRRVNLTGTNGSAPTPSSIGRAPLQRPLTSPVHGGAADAFAFAADQPLSSTSASAVTARMFEGAKSAFANGHEDDDMLGARTGNKRKASGDDVGSRPIRGRTMGEPSKPLAPIQEIRASRVALGSQGSGAVRTLLPAPSIQNIIRVQQKEEGAGVFTAENSADANGTHSVTFALNGTNVWLDFLPSPALAIVANSRICAAACEDGTVKAYSLAGRHLASLKLAAPAFDIDASKDMLLVVTIDSIVRVIDTRQGRAMFEPTSLAHLLDPPSTSTNPAPPLSIAAVTVRPNGCAVAVTSEPAAWAYDMDLQAWTQIASPWWAASPLTESRTRQRQPQAGWILAEIENILISPRHGERTDKPKWWDEAMSVGHYETRLRGARLLESKEEYRHWLKEYARYLGEENFRERAEDLLSDLIGPVYHHSRQSSWQPKLLGFNKRDLAKDALGAMARTLLASFASEQGQILKQISAEEARWT